MSLFADYKFEREGKHVIEGERGFIVFEINVTKCWLADIFVAREQRRKGHGRELTDLAIVQAKRAGCTEAWATCQPGLPGSSESLLAMLEYGFKLSHLEAPLVWLKMEI